MTNLEIARELFENISSPGAMISDTALALLHDDVIWEVCPGPAETYMPFCGTFHGKAGVENWIAECNEVMEIEMVDRNYEVGDQGRVFCFGDARMRINGKLCTFFFIEWVEIVNGKVARYKEVIDTARLQVALTAG